MTRSLNITEVFTSGPPSLRSGQSPGQPEGGAAASHDLEQDGSTAGAEHARDLENAIAVELAKVTGLEAQVADLREAIRGRRVIEQAKGLLMGTHRCDADRAWQLLKEASEDFDVPVRHLAFALTEAAAGQALAPFSIGTSSALRAAMSPSQPSNAANGGPPRRGPVGAPPGLLRPVDNRRLHLVRDRSSAG